MLNTQICDTAQQLSGNLPSKIAALIKQGAKEISSMDIIKRYTLRKGSTAPSFKLTNQYGESKELDTYLKQGPVVLTFYSGVWCPYCNLQLKAYRDRLDEITGAGATLVAITPEKPGALSTLVVSGAAKELVDMVTTNIKFDVLYDKSSQLAKRFGLQFELADSHKQLLQSFNVDIERLTGTDSCIFPDPATYVIDTDGTVNWDFVPNSYRKQAEVDDILEAIYTNSLLKISPW